MEVARGWDEVLSSSDEIGIPIVAENSTLCCTLSPSILVRFFVGIHVSAAIHRFFVGDLESGSLSLSGSAKDCSFSSFLS